MPKRKRSRPSEWWISGNSSPTQHDEGVGRPSMVEGILKDAPTVGNRIKRKAPDASEMNEDNQPAKPKRRRRSSNAAADVENVADAAASSSVNNQVGQKKRGRPPKSQTGNQPDGDASTKQKPGHKKRRRQSRNETELQSTATSSATNTMQQRRPGRPSNTDTKSRKVVLSPAREVRREQDAQVSSASNPKRSSATQQRSQPKKGKRLSDANVLDKASPQTRGNKNRPSTAESSSRKRKDVEKSNDEPDALTRNPPDKVPQENQRDALETDHTPNYQHLVAQTRQVPRHVIDTKWEPLPPACVELVSQMLLDIQRPVVVRLNDVRKRTQANTVLQMVSRRLISKISKGLPFPQGTRSQREDDFDFERILDHNRALEAQLTPTLHSNELLEAGLSKEIELLESEKAVLADLEANAKTEASRRRQKGRKLHALLLSSDSSMEEEEFMDPHFVGLDQSSLPGTSNTLTDANLLSIMDELNGHVDSIQGNMDQVKGISQAIAKSKAAVQSTLYSHLETQSYEDVVLG